MMKTLKEELSDEAENLGYTIDLAMGSPRFTNPVLNVLELKC